MNESSEIKIEINNLLKNMQLPKEIKTTINNIYKECEAAYEKLLLEMKQKNLVEPKEIQVLENYIKSDYKEDARISEIVEYEEYEQKRTKMVEVISRVLKGISDKENHKITQTVEKPTDKENKNVANIIVNITISEIESSAKNIAQKAKKIKTENQDLKLTVLEFEEEIIRIAERAKQSIPEISERLNNHYNEICEQLSEIIEKYNNGLESKKEEIDVEYRRKEFSKKISDYEKVKNVEITKTKQDEGIEELEH